jgi:short-subunit dehydrogenase
MDVKNKVVIVTGASSGIGYPTVKLFSEKGAKLALVARSKEKLEQLSKKLNDSVVLPADMTKPDEIKQIVKHTMAHFGRIDVLINCAGQGYDAPVERTDIAIFRHIFDLDVIGTLVTMQQVIPIMRQQNGGAIVNVSSGTALMYLPNNGAYSAMKRALASMSLTAREELKHDGIVVSVVYPFVTLTDFEKNTIKDPSLPQEELEEGELPFKPDTAEYAAQKILEGVESGEPEIFAHDWMTKPATRKPY